VWLIIVWFAMMIAWEGWLEVFCGRVRAGIDGVVMNVIQSVLDHFVEDDRSLKVLETYL